MDEHGLKLWVQRSFKDMCCYRISNFKKVSDKPKAYMHPKLRAYMRRIDKGQEPVPYTVRKKIAA